MTEKFYRVKSDRYNWILVEVRIVPEINESTMSFNENVGAEIETNVAYFNRLHQLKAYAAEYLLRVHGLDELDIAKQHLISIIEDCDKQKEKK